MSRWGDDIFTNDDALDWFVIFGAKLQSIIRSTLYTMKNKPNTYLLEFSYGFVYPLYMYWVVTSKVDEVNIPPPELTELQHWKSDFQLWWQSAITDEMKTAKPDYYKRIYEFTSGLLDKLLAHRSDFDNIAFEAEYNKDKDLSHLPIFENKDVTHYDFTHYLVGDLSDSLEKFVTSSFYENNLSVERGDWKTVQTGDAVFMAAVQVLYLFCRYCRYVSDEEKTKTQDFLFSPPRAYILEQWKDSYLKYLIKEHSEEEIKQSDYCQVRLEVFDKFIELANEYEALEEAEFQARRKGDK